MAEDLFDLTRQPAGRRFVGSTTTGTPNGVLPEGFVPSNFICPRNSILQRFSELYGIANFLNLSFVMEVVAGPQNCPVNAAGILEIFVTCTTYSEDYLSSLQ